MILPLEAAAARLHASSWARIRAPSQKVLCVLHVDTWAPGCCTGDPHPSYRYPEQAAIGRARAARYGTRALKLQVPVFNNVRAEADLGTRGEGWLPTEEALGLLRGRDGAEPVRVTTPRKRRPRRTSFGGQVVLKGIGPLQ